MEDQQLVKQLLNREPAAFTLFVKNTEGLVAEIVFKMIANAEDRKDLIQDIYLNAYRYLPNFRFQSKLSTWLGSIAYHACYNYLKKKKLLLSEKIDDTEHEQDTLEVIANRFADCFSNQTMDYVSQKELQQLLQSAIHQLSPIYATLISLYHYQELSYQEISIITGLPEGTLKSYLFRARKKLKDLILLDYKKEDL